ncbi:MAG: hypothetical protein ACJ76H_08890 [Bacteriovoracaceae bacterium]
MKHLFASFIFLFTLSAYAQIPDLRPLMPDFATVQDDFAQILMKANLTDSLALSYSPGSENKARIVCDSDKVIVNVTGDHRWSQAFYNSLTHLGFLFPHPRIQVSPTFDEVRSHCGEEYTWRPALKYHGFHLHTLHPSEWVHGFLMGQTDIALDTVRWFARNQQNIFDLSLLRQSDKTIFNGLRAPFALAKKMGIHAGIAFGAALHQQNSFKLISLLRTFSDTLSLAQIRSRLPVVLNNIDVSYINVEMGTTEFTNTNYPRTIKWLNEIADVADKYNVRMVTKVHCSSNQVDPKWGNYNFLPQYADPRVGILPHTVYLFGLEDRDAPMYGNQNFFHVLEFMLQEKGKRRTWFYPENSYFIALDIDVPLLLTDYLLTRSNDTKFLYKNNVEGQLVFTTGQEVGYWLNDWTSALLNNLDYNFDPKIGLKLLGENLDSWSDIIAFQNKWFKDKHLLGVVTFPNFGDELIPSTHLIYPRNFLKKLWKDPELLANEIALIEEAIKEIPQDVRIKNPELRAMWDITEARVHHALLTRRALAEPMMLDVHLDEAAQYRNLALARMKRITTLYSRYPGAKIFEWHKNPTAYPWGYAYPAATMHYWVREEEQIRKKNFSPFFMNITDFMDIIFKKTGLVE